MIIRAAQALLPTGWGKDIAVHIGPAGKITKVEDWSLIGSDSHVDHHVGILLPAPVNVHSHAFQRAMAGLTEQRGPDPGDSFWTWRKLMYRFLDRLTPDHVQAVTAFVQMEMLEAGYTTNAEFHYLHHQPDGHPYDNLAELSERVVAASEITGIGLTLLPVLYQFGGCDKRPLGAGQIRFGNDLDRMGRLCEGAAGAISAVSADACIGVAPHSLRAVDPASLGDITALSNGGPIHIHLAEQIAEVEEVQSAWGKRPVEWLLDNADVDDRWCLIHVTQMLPHETVDLAQSGAVAGLCPITESNLGDGIFDGVNWFAHKGKTAIGSDSNIRISLSEELRQLDYSQRLRDHSRAALATSAKSTGRKMYDAILEGGAQAANRQSGKLEAGYWADMLVLDEKAVDLFGRTEDTLLDSFIFAGDDRLITDVWAAGRHVVKQGYHIAREKIVADYITVMTDLGETI